MTGQALHEPRFAECCVRGSGRLCTSGSERLVFRQLLHLSRTACNITRLDAPQVQRLSFHNGS